MCTLKQKRKTVNKCRFKIPTKSAQKHTNEYENTTWLTISFVIGDWTWDVCMYICSAFLWRYEPVRRTGKSHDWLTVFFARIIRLMPSSSVGKVFGHQWLSRWLKFRRSRASVTGKWKDSHPAVAEHDCPEINSSQRWCLCKKNTHVVRSHGDLGSSRSSISS